MKIKFGFIFVLLLIFTFESSTSIAEVGVSESKKYEVQVEKYRNAKAGEKLFKDSYEYYLGLFKVEAEPYFEMSKTNSCEIANSLQSQKDKVLREKKLVIFVPTDRNLNIGKCNIEDDTLKAVLIIEMCPKLKLVKKIKMFENNYLEKYQNMSVCNMDLKSNE